jgi:hypothetical protein
MTDAPLLLRYDGDGTFNVPSQFWAGKADKQFVVGEILPMVPHQERSDVSHNHEFAFIAEAWRNLPEQFRDEPWAQSPEHLRKYALIRCRFCNTQTYPCASRAEADRWAANLRPKDEYSIVKAEGNAVYVFTAMSQKKRGIGAMDKKTFQASKQAIMDFVDDLLGVERGATAKSEAA